MALIEENTSKKVKDVLQQITGNLVSEEYKEYFDKYLRAFILKTANQVAEVFLHSFVAGVEVVLKKDDNEFKLAAVMLVYSLVSRIKDKKAAEYSELAALIEEKICPKLFDLFTFLRNELTTYEEVTGDDGSKRVAYELRMRKLTMLSIVVLMKELRSVFHTLKKVAKNFDNFYQMMRSSEDLDAINQELGYTNFNIIECQDDLFAKDGGKAGGQGEGAQIQNCLEVLADKREMLYTYMVDDPSEENSQEFDIRVRDYLEIAMKLQDLILEYNGGQLDEEPYAVAKSELQFANFLLKDAQMIAEEQEMTFNDMIEFILDSYTSIFSDAGDKDHMASIRRFEDKDQTMDIPEVKTPHGDDQSYMETRGIRNDGSKANLVDKMISRYGGTKEYPDGASPEISKNRIRKGSYNNTEPQIVDEPAKPKMFMNLFENQKVLENKKDISNLSLDRNEYVAKSFRNKSKIEEDDHFKSFDQNEDVFKAAFENAGKFNFNEDQGLKFKKPNTEDLRFKTDDSMQRSGQGFDLKDFGEFGDFKGDLTHTSKKNFSDFGNFNDESKKNVSGYGNPNIVKTSGVAVQQQKSMISSNNKTSPIVNNVSLIAVEQELKFNNTNVPSSKPSFKELFANPETTPQPYISQPMTSSFTSQIHDRFKKSKVNISAIEKKSNSSFIGVGSVNINFGGSKFNSKQDNMTSSRISVMSNQNRQLLKNAMTKHTPTLLTGNHTTINSSVKPRHDEKRASTTLRIEPAKKIPAPAPAVVIKQARGSFTSEITGNPKLMTKDLVESQINQPKDNEPAFNFDDFQSIANNESQLEEASVNTMSNIIPASFKYSISRTSKLESNQNDNPYPLINPPEQTAEQNRPSKTLSVYSNAIKPNDNLVTPFDTHNKSMQSESRSPFTPKTNLDGMKTKYNDIIEKHHKELLVLRSNHKSSTVQNDNVALKDQIRRQNVEFDRFFEQMKNDYEALIDTFKSGHVEQQQENQRLLNKNEELTNRIFQLQHDLETQIELKNVTAQSLNDQLTKNQKSFEMLKNQQKANYEAMLKKVEADFKEKTYKLNREIEKLTVDNNDKVSKYLIENNTLKLELANVSSNDQTRVYDVKKQVDDVRTQLSSLRNECLSKIKSHSEQMKALSPKFQELITLRNKLMNESLISKSEITFYDRKAKELKDKLERVEQENYLLRSKTMKSSQMISTGNLMGLKTVIVNMKTEISKLGEQVDQDAHDYRIRIANLKQLKASKTLLENKLFNLEIQNNSRIGQINRLNFQFEGMKEENEYLKQRVSDLLEQKKNLQNQILEITKEPTNFIQNTANDVEMPKKIRELEYEVKSLNEINKEITEDNITMKEKLIKLEASNNSEKLRRTLKQLEAENEDLYQRNKCLLNELYEFKASSQGLDKIKERVKVLEKENSQVKAINNQLTLKVSHKNNENMILYDTKDPDTYANLRGTAFIKKYDMYLDLFNNKRSKIGNKAFLDLLQLHENKSEFAQKCIVNNYCLFRDGGFKIYVEEHVIHRTNNIDLVLKLTFSNLVTNPNHIMNFKIVCAGGEEKKYTTSPFNVELNGMEVAKKEVRVVFEESYLISGVPLIAEFCMLENYKMKKFLTGEENSILDDNMHSILFPIAVNKLLIYQKAESNLFSVIKSLSNVGSITLKNLTNIGKDDVYGIFPNLEIIGNNKYGVKILSIYGNFLLTLDVSTLLDYKIDLFSMYENPIHEIYLATLKAVLPLV